MRRSKQLQNRQQKQQQHQKCIGCRRVVHFFLIIIAVGMFAYNYNIELSIVPLLVNNNNVNNNADNNDNNNKIEMPPRKIFIDLGANCGNTYLKRKKQFDDEDNENKNKNEKEEGNNNLWEIYLWEPSPQMHEFFLNDLQKDYPTIQILPYAAGVGENKDIQLYVHRGQEDVRDKSQFRDKGRCNPNSAYNPSGATTVFNNANNAGKPVVVKQVNFPQWLRQMKLRIGIDRFLFKIDIEGAELDIMEELLMVSSSSSSNNNTNNKSSIIINDDNDYQDNSICVAELIEMEFHKNIFQKGTEDFVRHELFENTFEERFVNKCGRKPNLRKLS